MNINEIITAVGEHYGISPDQLYYRYPDIRVRTTHPTSSTDQEVPVYGRTVVEVASDPHGPITFDRVGSRGYVLVGGGGLADRSGQI